MYLLKVWVLCKLLFVPCWQKNWNKKIHPTQIINLQKYCVIPANQTQKHTEIVKCKWINMHIQSYSTAKAVIRTFSHLLIVVEMHIPWFYRDIHIWLSEDSDRAASDFHLKPKTVMIPWKYFSDGAMSEN